MYGMSLYPCVQAVKNKPWLNSNSWVHFFFRDITFFSGRWEPRYCSVFLAISRLITPIETLWSCTPTPSKKKFTFLMNGPTLNPKRKKKIKHQSKCFVCKVTRWERRNCIWMWIAIISFSAYLNKGMFSSVLFTISSLDVSCKTKQLLASDIRYQGTSFFCPFLIFFSFTEQMTELFRRHKRWTLLKLKIIFIFTQLCFGQTSIAQWDKYAKH